MTGIDKKIEELRKVTSNFLFIDYYTHTNAYMYKINNEYTRFNRDTLVLGKVEEGIEYSLDIAIEEIGKRQKEFFG